MRESNKERILDAALRVVQQDGITALTFDAVAAESGITRGGIIYHFKSRGELIDGVHRHVAQQWEQKLHHELGERDPATATADQRLAAYARTCAETAQRADLQLILESVSTPGRWDPWHDVFERWSPVPDLDTDAGLQQFLTRLAADGLWLFEALSHETLTTQQRQRVSEAIVQSVTGPAGETTAPTTDEGR